MQHQPPNGEGAPWVRHLSSPFRCLRVFSADLRNIGPRTLCNACGLVYAKLVRQNVSIVVPFSFENVDDNYRSKNGNVMLHAAQLMHRTRMTAPQQTTRRVATRTSRHRKSFVWRTSMWAVADGHLALNFGYFLMITVFHTDVVYFAFG
jgi:hypothetical protein